MPKTFYVLAWKDKILDYEIETYQMNRRKHLHPRLEKIRFSITRLKQCIEAGYFMSKLETWKDKILDYEIETGPLK